MTSKTMTFAQAVSFQRNLMKLQMELEDIFIEIAKSSDKHCIILFDRGVLDGSAYTNENVWQAILDETGWSTIQLRDRRYEAVIHMMTAAEGAQNFFEKDIKGGNTEEQLEEAREIDKKLISAWCGHPQFSIVKNSKKGFKTKIGYCLNKVLSLVGMPLPTSLTRKYLLVSNNRNFEIRMPADSRLEVFTLEETFIKTVKVESNILRKLGKNDSYTYSHEMRYDISGEKVIKKRQITAREYIELCEMKDPKKNKILKIRQCFTFDRQYFIVETFKYLDPYYISILRVETTDEQHKPKLPTYLDVLREVTGEDHYETWFMAKIDYKMPEQDFLAIQQKLA